MTTKTKDMAAVRTERALHLTALSEDAAGALAAAAAAVRKRDLSMEAAQGPRTRGKFSYTELAQITGLSRSRVNQIITAMRSQ